MAYPNHSGTKCPKCNNTSFELVEDFPTGSNYKFQYIRCSSCHTFLQAVSYHNTNVLIENLEAEIKKIKSQLDRIGAVSAENDSIIVKGINQWGRRLEDLITGNNKKKE